MLKRNGLIGLSLLCFISTTLLSSISINLRTLLLTAGAVIDETKESNILRPSETTAIDEHTKDQAEQPSGITSMIGNIPSER